MGSFKHSGSEINSVKFSYKNDAVLIGTKAGEVKTFDIKEKDGQITSFDERSQNVKLASGVKSFSVSYDNKFLACVAQNSKKCEVYDYESGALI